MRRVLFGVVLLGLILVPTPAYATSPGAVFTCNATGQYARVDPIVSPGMQSAHEHVFYGAFPIEETETTADLRSKPTTCIVAANHSGYWMPTVYRNGVRLLPATAKHLLIYYRCKIRDCSLAEGFPDDFTEVAGNAHATTADENPVLNPDLGGYRCTLGGGEFTPMPPDTCDSEYLIATVTFPVVGGVRLQMYFRWQLPSSDVGDITLGAIGASPLTLHADYFFGWERDAFENFMDTCIRASVICPNNFS